MAEHKYISLGELEGYIPEAARLGVSEVARSKNGFVYAYTQARGRPDHLPDAWRIKRKNFIKRHLVQYNKNPTYRHWLALMMWAYQPRRAPKQ